MHSHIQSGLFSIDLGKFVEWWKQNAYKLIVYVIIIVEWTYRLQLTSTKIQTITLVRQVYSIHVASC